MLEITGLSNEKQLSCSTSPFSVKPKPYLEVLITLKPASGLNYHSTRSSWMKDLWTYRRLHGLGKTINTVLSGLPNWTIKYKLTIFLKKNFKNLNFTTLSREPNKKGVKKLKEVNQVIHYALFVSNIIVFWKMVNFLKIISFSGVW